MFLIDPRVFSLSLSLSSLSLTRAPNDSFDSEFIRDVSRGGRSKSLQVIFLQNRAVTRAPDLHGSNSQQRSGVKAWTVVLQGISEPPFIKAEKDTESRAKPIPPAQVFLTECSGHGSVLAPSRVPQPWVQPGAFLAGFRGAPSPGRCWSHLQGPQDEHLCHPLSPLHIWHHSHANPEGILCTV